MTVKEGWTLVRDRERFITGEIDPEKLLPGLHDVLTDQDREAIRATCKNHGKYHATHAELLSRLKRRGPLAFSKFVTALRETGFSHTAQLLDPHNEVSAPISHGRNETGVCLAGVAADIRVAIRCQDLNQELKAFSERYNEHKESDSVKLRLHFSRFITQEIRAFFCFVKTTWTEDCSLILIFRLSKLDVAKSFWDSYQRGRLKLDLQEALRTFEDDQNCFKRENLDFGINIEDGDFEKVLRALENPDEPMVLVDGMEKKELKLRDYQLELVRPAFEGKNVIICSPTGSGKTFVAMAAIKHHVECPSRKKIAFIVNTVSLVEHQVSRLDQYLPDPVRISSLCGSNPHLSLRSILEDNDVIVVTAQCLLNSLERRKEPQSPGQAVVDDNGVTIMEFSLLVFDECHHTKNNHPYNRIMRCYLKEKIERSSHNLPQVMGLSASLGVGTGNSGCGTRAENHIMEICANLDVHELQVYEETAGTETSITAVPRDRNNVFHQTISDVMREIETMMSLSSSDNSVHPYGSQPYENWIINILKKDLGRDLTTCGEHLKAYNDALIINDVIRCEDALKHLKENVASEASTAVETELQEISSRVIESFQNDTSVNPGLQEVERRLQERLIPSEDGVPSKGIIFVGTRLVARAMLNWLKNSETLQGLVRKPSIVVGCGQRNGEGGMAKARQDHEIKNFRDGDCNVIVATSALLEGIDVPSCNFVINYGMPGNEITYVQARGRVRTQGCHSRDYTYDIIVPSDQRMLKERDLNKEKLMKDSIAKIKRKSKQQFAEEVTRIQNKAYAQLRKALQQLEPRDNAPVPDDVDFYCVKCGEFACKAKHIKKYRSAHIVPDHEQNLPNFSFKETSDKKYFSGGFNKAGKISCSKCAKDWGNYSKNEHGEFPVLKITGFRVKRNRQGGITYKKWQDFPFKLSDFETENDDNLQTGS